METLNRSIVMKEWNTCTEQMPEENGDYLVKFDDGEVCEFPFNQEQPYRGWYEPLDGCMIVHWQELVVVEGVA